MHFGPKQTACRITPDNKDNIDQLAKVLQLRI